MVSWPSIYRAAVERGKKEYAEGTESDVADSVERAKHKYNKYLELSDRSDLSDDEQVMLENIILELHRLCTSYS